MFNSDEFRPILKGTGIGILVGIVLCVFSFMYEFFAEFVNCFCDVMGEGDMIQEIDLESTFQFVFIASTVIGFLIGFFIALSARLERRDVEKEHRYTRNQEELAKKMQKFLLDTTQSKDNIHKPYIGIRYQEEKKKNDMEEAFSQCRQCREHTEQLVERLTSEEK